MRDAETRPGCEVSRMQSYDMIPVDATADIDLIGGVERSSGQDRIPWGKYFVRRLAGSPMSSMPVAQARRINL
jgi:hypothetical protein